MQVQMHIVYSIFFKAFSHANNNKACPQMLLLKSSFTASTQRTTHRLGLYIVPGRVVEHRLRFAVRVRAHAVDHRLAKIRV